MSLRNNLSTNRKYIIMGSMGVGILYILEFLPQTIDLLGDMTIYAYIGLIGLGMYTYYSFHWNSNPAGAGMKNMVPTTGYQKTVPSRKLGNPNFARSVSKHSDHGSRSAASADPSEAYQSKAPPRRSTNVFDKFHEE